MKFILPIHPYNTFPGNCSNDLCKKVENAEIMKSVHIRVLKKIFISHGLDRRPNKIYNLNGLPVELQPKPKPNDKPNLNPKPNTKPTPNPNPNPHGSNIKGTPRAQKENLDKSYENMAIKTKI